MQLVIIYILFVLVHPINSVVFSSVLTHSHWRVNTGSTVTLTNEIRGLFLRSDFSLGGLLLFEESG